MAARKKPATAVDVTGRPTWPAGWDAKDLAPPPARKPSKKPAPPPPADDDTGDQEA